MPTQPTRLQALIGLPRLRPIEYSRLKKREKRVNRAYGGSRCAHCVRERVVRAFLIEVSRLHKLTRINKTYTKTSPETINLDLPESPKPI